MNEFAVLRAFAYRDGGCGQVRVWNTEWSWDTFEVMEQKDFDVFKTCCEKLGIILTRASDED
jgi:hypothetical protein